MCLGLGSSGGAAQDGGPTLAIRAGFAGVYKIGSQLPVQVTIDNRETDLFGSLEVEIEGARASLPVSLPAPSKKAYALDLRAAEYGSEVRARLTAGGRSWEARAGLSPMAWDTELLVVVPAGPPALGPASMRSPAPRFRTVEIAGRDLPTGWRVYRGIDGLILAGSAAGALRPAQRTALTRWLQVGGRIAVTSERPEWLRPVLLEFAAFDPGAPLGEDPQRYRWGRGVLLAAPAGAPSAEEMWSLLAAAAEKEGRQSDLEILRSTAASARFIARPAAVLLVGGLLYLAALVGLWALARRSRRPLPSLAATAVAAIAFSIVALFPGRLAGGAGLAVREHRLVQVFTESREAFVLSWADYVSARRQRIDLYSGLDGGDVEVREGPAAAAQRLDAEGRRRLSLGAGMWARGSAVADGFVDLEKWLPSGLAAAELVRGVAVAGLSDCRHPAAAPAGASADRRGGAVSLQDRLLAAYGGRRQAAGRQTLVCSIVDPPSALVTDPPVRRLAGEAVAVLHLPGSGAEWRAMAEGR